MIEDYPQWVTVAKRLTEQGIDIKKISTTQHHQICRQLFIEHDIGNGYNINILDEEDWRQIADELIEHNPSWATPERRRIAIAEDLIASYHEGAEYSYELLPEDLAKHRYAVVAWIDTKSMLVYSAGDSIADVLDTIYHLHYLSESDEAVDFYVDLDTGDYHHMHKQEFSSVITLCLNGVEKTFYYDRTTA